MEYMIKELRGMTGLSQKSFAERLRIPLSTLRKWEQGDASPAPYVVRLIAGVVPGTDRTLKKIAGKDGSLFYYDTARNAVLDRQGTVIMLRNNLNGVKELNLPVYLGDLFESYYEALGKFERDCKYDKDDNIIWS